MQGVGAPGELPIRSGQRALQQTLGREEVTSIIRPANVASIRVATALGARAAETVDFFGAPATIYRYPRE
jgi:RimJ/RimL family protein N-acetyltransferase